MLGNFNDGFYRLYIDSYIFSVLSKESGYFIYYTSEDYKIGEDIDG